MDLDEQLVYLSHSLLPTLKQVSLCSQVTWFRVPDDINCLEAIEEPGTQRIIWVALPRGHHREVVADWLESVEHRDSQNTPGGLAAIPRAAVDWVSACDIADDDSILDELDGVPQVRADFQGDDSWSTNSRESEGFDAASQSDVDAAYESESDEDQTSESSWDSEEEYASIGEEEMSELLAECAEISLEGMGELPSSSHITREDWETIITDRRTALGANHDDAPRETYFQIRHGSLVDQLLEELDPQGSESPSDV